PAFLARAAGGHGPVPHQGSVHRAGDASARDRSGADRFSVVKGRVTPEEWLYPQIQEALTAWTITHRPGHVVYRIVGEQWAPRSHELRDTLGRNGVPFEFYAADSAEGRQLISEHGIDVRRLPAVIHHGGQVWHDPSFAEVA